MGLLGTSMGHKYWWQMEHTNEIMSPFHLKLTTISVILRIKFTFLSMACNTLYGLLPCNFSDLISFHSFPYPLCSSLDIRPTIQAHFHMTALSIFTTYSWKTLSPGLCAFCSFTLFKFLCKHLFPEDTPWPPSLIDHPLCSTHCNVTATWNYLLLLLSCRLMSPPWL